MWLWTVLWGSSCPVLLSRVVVMSVLGLTAFFYPIVLVLLLVVLVLLRVGV
jgi:hypothetical protein